MKKTYLLAIVALLLALPTQAQKKNSAAPTGGITPEMMQQLKQS